MITTDLQLYLVVDGEVFLQDLDTYKAVQKELSASEDWNWEGVTFSMELSCYLDRNNHVWVIAETEELALETAIDYDERRVDYDNYNYEGQIISVVKQWEPK